MCGFVFLYKKNIQFNFDKRRFLKASKLISHRGPDDFNCIFEKNFYASFFRLSIRDISKKGRQPMFSKNKSKVIVFNGEIYNSDKLKQYLDYRYLKSNSDTEILVNLYDKFGEKILDKLEGMFSFVVYDFKNNKCTLVRDRFGIKPLYFYEDNNVLIASSEIKPILYLNKKINFDYKTVADFLLKGYLDHGTKTFFDKINQLLPASIKYVSGTKNNNNYYKYWELKPFINNKDNYNYSKKKLGYLLNQSVKKHLISDRKIGISLSGGTDSTAIASIAEKFSKKKIETFTYDFSNNLGLGESSKAKKVAGNLNFNNSTILIKPIDIIDNFEKTIKILESPLTSIRNISQNLLYKETSNNNVIVILEGHGGDEMAAGYEYNVLPKIIDQSIKNKNEFDFEIFFKEVKKLNYDYIKLRNHLITYKFQGGSTSDGTPYIYIDLFKKKFLKKFISCEYYFSDFFDKEFNNLQKSQLFDINYIKLPRALKYTDKLSMYYGIESRVPFLDHKLFEYIFNLRNNFKFKDGKSRFILKDILEKQLKGFETQKVKQSIADPQSNWFKTELKDFIYDQINSRDFNYIGIFDHKKIISYLDSFVKNKIPNSFNLMQIISLSVFFRLFRNYKDL